MGRIIVVNHVTLDGVMQSPGSPDEDPRDGFDQGGWAQPYGDEVMGRVMGEGMSRDGALLFGRWTYEQFAQVWPGQTGNPVSELLDARTKYVASRTLREPLQWANSVLLEGDAAASVAELRRTSDLDITVLGSGQLLETLIRHDLVDEYLLTIHPLVLGAGRRLFGNDGTTLRLELIESIPTTTGVIIARYRPHREG